MLPQIASGIIALTLLLLPGNHTIAWNGIKIAEFENEVPINITLRPFIFNGVQTFSVDGKEYRFELYRVNCHRDIELSCNFYSKFEGVKVPYEFKCDEKVERGEVTTVNGSVTKRFNVDLCRRVEFTSPGFEYSIEKLYTLRNCADFPEHLRVFVYKNGEIILEKEVKGRICFTELSPGKYILETSNGERYELIVEGRENNPLSYSVVPLVFLGLMVLGIATKNL